MTLLDRCFLAAQYLLPHHLLSRIVGWLAESEWAWIRKPLMIFFLRRYGIDLTEAERTSIDEYHCFNDFFTRALQTGARDLSPRPQAWLCPVDATVSQVGKIQNGQVVQAKGKQFTVDALLGGDPTLARRYANGEFTTLYLSPKDYHRIHMPKAARLVRSTFIPGRLFSVNPLTASHVNNLFARNERLVCEFESDSGRFVMVLVGAMIVASIETTWAGIVAPFQRRIMQQHYTSQAIAFDQAEEMGRFRLGSTVVMLFEPNQIDWSDDIRTNATVRLGQVMNKATESVQP